MRREKEDMKRCFIVGAGDFYGGFSPSENDLVIAADGGLLHLLQRGIKPDVVIGDFDSLNYKAFAVLLDKFLENEEESHTRVKKITKISSKSECIQAMKDTFEFCEIISHPIEKDETDMYLAYEIGKKKECTIFYLYGGVGGREDHTFANYCLLLKAKNDKNQAFLIGNNTKSFVIENEKVEICGIAGNHVSVFAFGTKAEGVFIKGLKYEADDVTLTTDFPLGVSNSFDESKKAEISVARGALLIMVEE